MMPEVEQHEIPFQERRFKNPRMRRGIFLLPSLFTAANLLCGYYAVVAALVGGHDDFDHAAKAIGLAIVFDSMDGRVARMTGTNTEFGVQFDSLADVCSFGIAPAVLAYAWGVRSLPGLYSEEGHWLSQFGWMACLTFLVCCAWRLARFNVQGMAPGGSKFFVGMPTPAAAGVIAAIIHRYKYPLHDWRWSIVWLVLAVCLGALMISTIRYYSFKDLPWTRKQPSLGIILVLIILGVAWVYSEYVLMIFACSYAAIGAVLHLARYVRHRLSPKAAVV
ncbi:MAG TPA: CDP-diacylglycerol--serine O-phosphatidyltransferase [Candidatus Dormibacteraeota bacterium]|nr:CDP-diacylglycerol--serine O-phosphatidyltransferase [Candidatus Dormibacteraeota bacterium]